MSTTSNASGVLHVKKNMFLIKPHGYFPENKFSQKMQHLLARNTSLC